MERQAIRLFQTHQDNVVFMERRIESPRDVCLEAVVSDDVRLPSNQDAIRHFWESFLGRLKALGEGAPLDELPLDRRFVMRIESSLELPISRTLNVIIRKYGSEEDFEGTT